MKKSQREETKEKEKSKVKHGSLAFSLCSVRLMFLIHHSHLIVQQQPQNRKDGTGVLFSLCV